MKISKINISNILGIEQLEITPEGFTTIAGANGTGKTSVLEAIKAALGTGHDATLLRNGADKGEVVLVLDDGMEIRRKVTANTSSTEVRADGKKTSRPAEAIARLTDMLSINPIEFLTAKKQDRVKVLLEAMPLEIDCDALSAAAGIPVNATPGLHALHVIETVRKQVFDDRTGTNRAVKEKEATINQIRLAMPDKIGEVEGNAEELQVQIDAAAKLRDITFSKIKNKMDSIKSTALDKIGALRIKLQEDIDALKSAAQETVDTINSETNLQSSKAADAVAVAANKYIEVTGPINAAITAMRSNASAVAKRQQATETIELMQDELKSLIKDAEAQTKALVDIDAYKTGLLAALPILGVEIKDGEIYQNGVPLDRLNTAAQVGIAVEVAKLRAGELGVVCIDRVESLDSDTLAAFKDAVSESGLQLFITRVSDGEFSIS